jgi:hypothetical protein
MVRHKTYCAKINGNKESDGKSSNRKRLIRKKVRFNGHELIAFYDPGANTSYMSYKTAAKYNIETEKLETPYQLSTGEGTLFTYNNGWVTKRTKAYDLQIGTHQETIQVDITNTDDELVLGRDWFYDHNPEVDFRTEEFIFSRCKCTINETGYEEITKKQMNAIIRKKPWKVFAACQIQTPETNEKPAEIPSQYKHLAKAFTKPEHIGQPKHGPWDHEIPLKEGQQPRAEPMRQNSPRELKALKEFIDENLPRGYLRYSQSTAGYQLLFVKKKNTDKLRVCVDYRHLNSITIKDSTSLPRIDETLDKIKGSDEVTKFDLVGAYYRLRMKEGEEWKTAFRTRYGSFEWLVMPMGLTNAPATWQRYISHLLHDLHDEGVVVYLDDVVIYTKNDPEKHQQLVKEVLRRFIDNELYVDIKKTQFHAEEVEFLGHIVGKNGVRMDPEKVAAIREWPTPQNLKDVQSFTGTCNYYRRFVKDYGKIAMPLYRFTRKGQPFKWDQPAEEAFRKLIQLITEEPILKPPDENKPYIVETDASDYAMGARLCQEHNGKRYPIAFISKKFTDTESRYPIHDKELYAIVFAKRQWRHYLEGAKHTTIVYSDHKNLTYFFTTKELSGRLVRWWEELSTCDMKIVHTPGKDNGPADALSRRPDHDNKQPVRNNILQQQPDGTITVNRMAATVQQDDTALLARVRHLQSKDHVATEQLQTQSPGWNKTNNLVYFKGRLYVPQDKTLRKEIMEQYHDAPIAGHLGVQKTLERLRRTWFWPGMLQQVKEYVLSCDLCFRNKAQRHKQYGQLQDMPIPERSGQHISCDFITGLPLSRDPVTGVLHDAICVVIDKLTKYAWLVPWHTGWDAKDFAHIFLRIIFQEIGIPEVIISDRDTKFTSDFWQTVTSTLGLKTRLSSAYHAPTDGQTERMNQIVEQYLRSYLDYLQTSWVQFLPTAQFSYNSAMHETTKTSPHYARFGFEPTPYGGPYENTHTSEEGLHVAQQWKEITSLLQDEVDFQNQRRRFYYNQHRQAEPSLKEGDEVYLLRRNITTKRPSDKLDYKKLGPFKIERKINNVTYRLTLPRTMKIFNTFHVSLLEPVPKGLRRNRQIYEPHVEDEDDDREEDTIRVEQNYEVEKILDSREENGELLYHVKWKGYSAKDNTWEPKQLLSCYRLIREYHESNPTKPR